MDAMFTILELKFVLILVCLNATTITNRCNIDEVSPLKLAPATPCSLQKSPSNSIAPNHSKRKIVVGIAEEGRTDTVYHFVSLYPLIITCRSNIKEIVEPSKAFLMPERHFAESHSTSGKTFPRFVIYLVDNSLFRNRGFHGSNVLICYQKRFLSHWAQITQV